MAAGEFDGIHTEAFACSAARNGVYLLPLVTIRSKSEFPHMP
jgi:hypothetical protein